MSPGTVDSWLVAALAEADPVLLLGDGWGPVARTLAHRGAKVVTDREHEGTDVRVTTRDAARAEAFTAVGVALGTSSTDLDDVVAASDDDTVVVTRLDTTDPGVMAGLARAWPLAHRTDLLADDAWVASWTVDDTPTMDLAQRLTTALATAAGAMRSVADAAREVRDGRDRDAGVAQRQAAAADARAKATAALADRWIQSQEALLTASRGPADTPARAPTWERPAGARGLRGALRSITGTGRSETTTTGSTSRRRVHTRLDAGPGWRVATLAGPAAAWLGGWVDAAVLEPADLPLGGLLAATGDHLDVLVIGAVPRQHQPDVATLATEAGDAGVAVVGVVAGGTPWPGFGDLCDVMLTDDPDRAGPRLVAAAPPVDPRVVNPIGFRSRATGLATLVTGPDRDLAEVIRAVATVGADSRLVGAGTDRGLAHDVAARVRGLRRVGGVVDVPAAHASHAEHARTLVGLATAGIPVYAPGLPDAVADLLGPTLAATLTGARLTDLDDVTDRERLSVHQRRAALWDHTIEARWRRLGPALDLATPPRPAVSAVVVTNRPGHLRHCAGELSRQTYRPLEVVIGLHGSRFTRPDIDAFVRTTGLPVTTVAVDGHRTLGEGLNLACRAATGDVIVKWDDDDFYGPDHVVDLVQALDYSGATIVGKGSEFIHLDQLDITIRRFVGNAETGSRSLAGGTLALRRDDLAEVGWWRRVPRSVDQSLLDDVERAGGTIHRTHGFGFVLARRASGHTWSVDLDYFLGLSEAQWRGLARATAGLDDHVLPLPSPTPR